jgi:hypothetical protein
VFERITDYFIKCIQKIQREGIKSMVVREEAVEDFCEFTETYFPGTVFAQSVRSCTDAANTIRSYRLNLTIVLILVQDWKEWQDQSVVARECIA